MPNSLLKPMLIGISCLVCNGLIAQPDTIFGYAYDARRENLRYVESYHQVYNAEGHLQQSQVRYLSPNEELLATKTLDYEAHPYAPEFTFDNKVAAYEESLHWISEGRVRVRHREADQRWQEKVLTVEEPVVADAGFDAFLKDQLPRLVAGQTIEFNFLNPARLDWFRFNAQPLTSTQTTIELKVAPTNPVLRWLVEPILLTYQLPTAQGQAPRLLYYSGLTNMSINGEDTIVANIFYEYETRPPRQIVNLF
ncbi:MAG: hypothetical protein CSH49_14400 [Alcanivorax sp.]|nr:MAG: hypothetical protein CSH49_14400 [Alcanivorax sp.]